jgi:hypothetical protein
MDNAVFAVTGRRAACEFPGLESREEDASPDARPEPGLIRGGGTVGAATVDAVRYRLDVGWIGDLNYAFVWLAILDFRHVPLGSREHAVASIDDTRFAAP